MTMVLNVVPTRMELQNLKSKCTAAVRGHDLLKKKSDALTLKFRSLLRDIRETKLQVGELAKEALFAFTEVKFVASDISPTVIQSVTNMPQMLFMTIDNIAGVRVPNFQRVNTGNDVNTLVGLSRGGQQIQKAREAFSNLLDALIRLSMLQTSFGIIDEVLKITNRRVNAMEYVIIPRYQNTIAFVNDGLEEEERESFYRLKKVQQKRKEMAEQEEVQRLARFAKDAEPQEQQEVNLFDDSTDSSDLLF
ncbi:V-type proton ATPase subunit D [Histomonas meleagridis]|uniref:V-type proton ATPase subunit D n=1 Tax=Histomonas meleagridis TaxID=135588 RepID=UPI00355A309C|nr:V-type proton ATPase subunit D [Histomonas meleagridis]KAH0796851.1 V-type proton ATPase subunit D [Histomonas meleagridis]